MKTIISIISFFLVFLVGCVEQGTGTAGNTNQNLTDGTDSVTVTQIDPATSTLKDDYTVSEFSQYVYFHNEEQKVLIDYNFFPSGSDVCDQATYNEDTNPNGCKQDKSLVLPCEYESLVENDLLSINISADSNTVDCDDPIVLDMSVAEFTVDGLVINFAEQVTVFEEDFEFLISQKGFLDASDLSLLSLEGQNIGLEEVYEKIISLRTAN